MAVAAGAAASLPLVHKNAADPAVRPVASLAAALAPEADAGAVALQVLPPTFQLTAAAVQAATGEGLGLGLGIVSVVLAVVDVVLGCVLVESVATEELPPPPHETKKIEAIKRPVNLTMSRPLLICCAQSMVFLNWLLVTYANKGCAEWKMTFRS